MDKPDDYGRHYDRNLRRLLDQAEGTLDGTDRAVESDDDEEFLLDFAYTRYEDADRDSRRKFLLRRIRRGF